ncbi:MAG: hypothetical protein WB777_14155 [Mycobacterium sp.]
MIYLRDMNLAREAELQLGCLKSVIGESFLTRTLDNLLRGYIEATHVPDDWEPA